MVCETGSLAHLNYKPSGCLTDMNLSLALVVEAQKSQSKDSRNTGEGGVHFRVAMLAVVFSMAKRIKIRRLTLAIEIGMDGYNDRCIQTEAMH